MTEIFRRYGILLRLGAIAILMLCGLIIPAVILAGSYAIWDLCHGRLEIGGDFLERIRRIFIYRSLLTGGFLTFVCFFTGQLQLIFWVLVYTVLVSGWRLLASVFRFTFPGFRLTPVASSMGLVPRLLMVFAYGSGLIQATTVLLVSNILNSRLPFAYNTIFLYPFLAGLCAPVSYVWARRLARDFTYRGALLLIVIWPFIQAAVIALPFEAIGRFHKLQPYHDTKSGGLLVGINLAAFIWLCGSIFLRFASQAVKKGDAKAKADVSGGLVCEIFACAILIGLSIFVVFGQDRIAGIPDLSSYHTEIYSQVLLAAAGMSLSAMLVSRMPWLGNMKWWEGFIRPLAGGAAVTSGAFVFKLADGMLFGLSPDERGWLILIVPVFLGKVFIPIAAAGIFSALALLPFRSRTALHNFCTVTDSQS